MSEQTQEQSAGRAGKRAMPGIRALKMLADLPGGQP